jgi:hypothetical protein
MFHWRQRCPIHHGNLETGDSQAAGESPADGASAYDTYIKVHFLPSWCNTNRIIPAQNIGTPRDPARGDFIPAAARFL